MTAGMFMADKANVKLTDTVTTTAVEGLDRVWLHSFAVIPPVPFVLEDGSWGVFKEDGMVDLH